MYKYTVFTVNCVYIYIYNLHNKGMGLSVSNNTLLGFEPTRFGNGFSNAPSSGLVSTHIYTMYRIYTSLLYFVY